MRENNNGNISVRMYFKCWEKENQHYKKHKSVTKDRIPSNLSNWHLHVQTSCFSKKNKGWWEGNRTTEHASDTYVAKNIYVVENNVFCYSVSVKSSTTNCLMLKLAPWTDGFNIRCSVSGRGSPSIQVYDWESVTEVLQQPSLLSPQMG